MLKNNNDIRSVVFMIITTFLLFFLWNYSAILPIWVLVPLYIAQLFMAVIASVMAHNHNHVPMWKHRFMNIFQENWLTVFYGFPVFAWIPTHNTNHHTHTNTEEDYTKTYRFTEKNNLFTLLIYPSISSYFQQGVVFRYYKDTFLKSKKKFFFHTLQIVSLVSWIGFALFFDWKKALLFVVIPQQVSLFSVLMFNYLQHVHADEEHKYNNSRNFTGKVLNFFLLNNGIHLAHHMYPSQHWSDLPETHKTIAPNIDPSLNEESYWGYLFKTYILGIFIPKYRSKSLRLKRLELEK